MLPGAIVSPGQAVAGCKLAKCVAGIDATPIEVEKWGGQARQQPMSLAATYGLRPGVTAAACHATRVNANLRTSVDACTSSRVTRAFRSLDHPSTR